MFPKGKKIRHPLCLQIIFQQHPLSNPQGAYNSKKMKGYTRSIVVCWDDNDLVFIVFYQCYLLLLFILCFPPKTSTLQYKEAIFLLAYGSSIILDQLKNVYLRCDQDTLQWNNRDTFLNNCLLVNIGKWEACCLFVSMTCFIVVLSYSQHNSYNLYLLLDSGLRRV